jgi:SAM-dependent methyltransferase
MSASNESDNAMKFGSAGGTAMLEPPVEMSSRPGAPAQTPRGPIDGAHFETMYKDARGDASRIPWADGAPNPALVNWLNAEACGMVRCGGRAVVVGCGLGDDVSELSARGYDACGFDVSPTAIDWAKTRFPALRSSFFTCDLLKLPPRLLRRFDLVIESYTLQSLDPSLREQAAAAVASMVGRGGVLLTIARGRDAALSLDSLREPPFAFTTDELGGLFRLHGLTPTRPIDDFLDAKQVRRLRAAWTHG